MEVCVFLSGRKRGALRVFLCPLSSSAQGRGVAQRVVVFAAVFSCHQLVKQYHTTPPRTTGATVSRYGGSACFFGVSGDTEIIAIVV